MSAVGQPAQWVAVTRAATEEARARPRPYLLAPLDTRGEPVVVWSSTNELAAGRFCRVQVDASGRARGSCGAARLLATGRCVHAAAAEEGLRAARRREARGDD